MIKRALIVLAFGGSAIFAADEPPSDASLKQLLAVTQTPKMIDSMMSQMDGVMKNALQQVTQGQQISAEVQETFDKARSEVVTTMKEQLTWEKLEPMYMRIYRKSFTEEEVGGMIAFYLTPTGQAVINKLPIVMQNSMNETMQTMGPMMERIKRMQREMVAQIKAERAKKAEVESKK